MMFYEKAKPKRQGEKLIQDEILEWFQYQRPKGFAFPINNSAPYNPSIGMFLRPSKWHRDGVPDILGVWMREKLGIEVKTNKGVQSEEQKDFEREWKLHGGIYILARSLHDVIKGLNIWEYNQQTKR